MLDPAAIHHLRSSRCCVQSDPDCPRGTLTRSRPAAIQVRLNASGSARLRVGLLRIGYTINIERGAVTKRIVKYATLPEVGFGDCAVECHRLTPPVRYVCSTLLVAHDLRSSQCSNEWDLVCPGTTLNRSCWAGDPPA